MARTKTYHHFCPVARALEVIGEKWSLLIVRDLMRGPKRFSDLRRYLGDITPKWLSLRLRELEEAGIVEREAMGRREVWYRLAEKGRSLRPVIEELAVWGIEHALRPPLAGEPVQPAHATVPFIGYWNRRGLRPTGPLTWILRFDQGQEYAVCFDGEAWSLERGGSSSDLTITVSPERWVELLTSPPNERKHLAGAIQLEGSPSRVAEFLALLSQPLHEAAAVAV
ncbi:MAG: winged helix-turn-helix transcriptional regulator [Dehalococcoidia bacterium]